MFKKLFKNKLHTISAFVDCVIISGLLYILCSNIPQFLITCTLYIALFCNRPITFLLYLHTEYLHKLWGDIIIIIINIIIVINIIIMVFRSPLQASSPHCFSSYNQEIYPPIKAQTLVRNTSRIMCDVPSIAVCSGESVDCLPAMSSIFVFKHFVTIPVAPIINGVIMHVMFHIRCNAVHQLLYFFTVSPCILIH